MIEPNAVPLPARPRQLLPLAVAIVYLAAAIAGLGATRGTDGLAALWPPNAILLAVLLLRPRHPWRYVAWCAVAAFAANLWFGTGEAASLIFTAANAAGVTVATVLGRRLGLAPTSFARPSDIVHFCGTALVAATTGALIAATSVLIQPGDALGIGLSWFLSDLLGLIVITPLGLMIAWGRRSARADTFGRHPAETIALLALVTATTLAVFYQQRYPLLFLPIAPLIAVTYRVGPTGTAAGIILIAAIGTLATLSGHGPVALAAGSIAAHIHFLQFYIATLFGVALPMAAALAHRRRLAASMAESERLLRLAGSVARLGHWRYDKDAPTVAWSDEVFRIHGIEPGTPPTLERAVACFHPDDRDIVDGLVTRALTHGIDYKFDARIVRTDGATRHVVVDGRVERDVDGAIVGLFGVIQDVTERALALRDLRASEERFRAITEQSGDMITLHEIRGGALFVSPSAASILGHDPAAIFGPSAFDWVVEADRAELERVRMALDAAPLGTTALGRVRMPRAAGGPAWMEVSARRTEIAGRARVVAIWRDVTAQVEGEAALVAARAEAEAAVAAKAQFLANMSHEIRTPMNGVLGFADLLLGTDLTGDQRHHAQLIADSGRAMMKLLNDILDVSKIDAGQLDIVPEPMDLHHALKACAALSTPAAEQKTLNLDLAIAPDVPRAILGDALRIRQVVLNLLGNAVKFTALGGVILSARREGDEIAITVRDTGIGIPPERQQAIFEQFVQADETVARRYGGSGLGLAISNRLAALMGGRLRLESAPGRGTAITLVLPLDEVDERALPAPRAAAIPATTARPARPAHVLLADDHDVNQVLVTMMLARAGHRVTIADDGIAAVARVQTAIEAGTPFDLVLMDMQMPGMDGPAAARAIRALPGGATVPIVALTANAFAADIETCRAAGMNDHLAKPVAADALLAAIERWGAAAPAPKKRGFTPSPELAERYAKQKAATLEALTCAVRYGAFTDKTVDDLADRLHKLAGTAAMFGDAQLGDHARALETNLRTWDADERIRRLRLAADALRRVA